MIRLFFAQSRSTRRVVAAFLAAILLITLAGIGMTLAQGNTTGKIKVGDTVTGTLDSKTFAQSYSLDGKAGDKITITATRKTTGLSLALILAGPTGTVVSQAAELTNAAVTLKDVALPADGQYLITVLRATGAQGTAKGDYTLTVIGVAVPTPASGSLIALPQGMSVTLSWNTADDLSLEVRDPVGGDINWRNPTANGGRLDNNTNADCATANANNPAETISWPGGNVPSGSYEIIVYYNKQCTPPVATAPPVSTAESPTLVAPATVAPIPPSNNATPAATVASTAQGDAASFAKFNPQGRSSSAQSAGVSFALTITVNGDTQDPIRGTLQLNQQYVTSYLLNSPTSVAVQSGGPNLSIDLQPFANKIAAPTALGTRTSVTGTINHNNPADAWSFDLTATRSVTIDMNATNGGSLDSFLVLLAADGSIITSNDDASPTTRDSEIANQTLRSGHYIIVATHFAQAIGGTEGNYTLTLSTKTGGTVTAIPLPNTTPVTTPAAGATTTSGALPTGSIEVLLTWDSRADLRLLIRDPAGQSVFSDNRNPTNSGILEREGNFKCPTTATTAPATYAYWPTNQILPGTYEVSVWMDSRCQDTNILPTYTLTITVNGKVIGSPIKDRPDPNKAHTLTTFTTDANGSATLGPVGIFTQNFNTDIPDIGNQLSSATALTIGTPATGTINAQTPIVLYQFQAKAKDHVIIDLKQSSGNLDPDMFLLDSTGKQLAENDDRVPNQDRNSHIDFTIKTDGAYIIVATRYGARLGGTSGTYELDTVTR